MKIFERRAIEELVEELPGVALRIYYRESSLENTPLDNFTIGTRLMEVRELVLLRSSIEDEGARSSIDKGILEEIDALIEEVDAHA